MRDEATDGARAGEAAEVHDVDAWRSAVSGALLRFDVDCARPERFHGSVRRIDLGEASLVAMTSRPHHAVRDAAHIDGSARTDYLLSLQLAGRAEFRQDRRRAVVRPGDMVFYDSGRPVEITSGEGYRSLCFRFPRHGVGGDRRAGDLTATTLGAAHGLTPAMAGLLTGLHASLDRNATAGPAALRAAVRQATRLARTMFDDELARRGLLEPAGPHERMRERVDRYIDEHLADPELSPRSIAAALFVSTRHLHALLADDGRTVATTIRRRRLDRCLADLADPRDAATPVSAIGARWGFPNATRFGQLVKAETGQTPSGYRHATLGRR